MSFHRSMLRQGCPRTVGYILLWAHVFWGLGVALSGGLVIGLYGNFPAVETHLWDLLAFSVAALLRVGLWQMDAGRGSRVLQVGGACGFVLWAWADVAFFSNLGPSSALVYTALAGSAAWLVYLTGDAWIAHA